MIMIICNNITNMWFVFYQKRIFKIPDRYNHIYLNILLTTKGAIYYITKYELGYFQNQLLMTRRNMDTPLISGNASSSRNMDIPLIPGNSSTRRNIDTAYSPNMLNAWIIIDTYIFNIEMCTLLKGKLNDSGNLPSKNFICPFQNAGAAFRLGIFI